jgi:hypothetical protein
MKQDLALSATLLLAGATAGAADVHGYQVPGTYQLSICESGCSATDSRKAFSTAVVVLTMRPLADKEPRPAGKGCFYVTNIRQSGSFVQKQISGQTEWTIEHGKLRFALFHEDDAGYFVELEMNHDGTEVRGTGRSRNPFIDRSDHERDIVVGYRSATADLANCDASNQVAAFMAREERYIPWSPLDETEAQALRAKFEKWGAKVPNLEDVIGDAEHYHTYREADIFEVYPQLRGSRKLSECSNSMKRPSTGSHAAAPRTGSSAARRSAAGTITSTRPTTTSLSTAWRSRLRRRSWMRSPRAASHPCRSGGTRST